MVQGVSGIKAEEEPAKLLKKRNSKCYLFMNNLKESSSEHNRKIPLDKRNHSRGWGEGWEPNALTVQEQESHYLKFPEHR